MSALTITKSIESTSDITSELLLKEILEAAKKEFSGVKIKEKSGKLPVLHCRVKTRLFNPIVSIKAPIEIAIQGKKAKILLDGDTSTNGWFWFCFIWCLFFLPLFLLMIWIYSSQKKASIEALRKVMDRMDFNLSSF